MAVEISYTTAIGQTREFEMDPVDLMEQILPDMRPPVSTITLNATGEGGEKYLVSISPGGIVVRLAEI